MNGEIILTQSPAYLILCLAAAVLVAGILYWRDQQLSGGPRIALALLRGLAIALLAFLLLGPLIRSIKTNTQKPTVVLAEDRSSSVASEHEQVKKAFDLLEQKLEERYAVERIHFGESIRAQSDTVKDQATDLSKLFSYASDNFSPELLAGIVVATDGIYNQGSDPIYTAERINTPAYAVMLGDTTPNRDLSIRDVLYNRISYLGDNVEVQLDLQASNLSGTQALLTLFEISGSGKSRQIGQQSISINSSRDFQTVRFEVNPKIAGVQRYRAVLSANVKERNIANNSRELYIDILDARQKILLLADAPHPDVSAIRQALENNKNFETSFALADQFQGDISGFDLVIFHNLPDGRNDVTAIVNELNDRKIGRLFIVGPKTSLAEVGKLQTLAGATSKGGTGNTVTPQLNGAFSLFSLPATWAQALKSYPPVTAPFAEYAEQTGGDVLLTQRVGRVSTDYPLLSMGESNGSKVGILYANDIWRWRLTEFQRTEQHEVFDGIVLATVQYLALKEDKRPFRVTTSERVFTTSDNIKLQGELYNASFQLVNESDVNIRVSDGEGTNYNFIMDKVGSAYQLNAGKLPAGDYSYSASTTYAGEQYEVNGAFSVQMLNLEALITTADWRLLRNLSEQQGGQAVTLANLDVLAKDLLADNAGKPVLYQSVETRPLIDWPWLLALILGLLSVEWFVRRRLGTY